jgi:hypothetical protein
MENSKKLIDWIETLLKDSEDDKIASLDDENMYHYFSGQVQAYATILFHLKLSNQEGVTK